MTEDEWLTSKDPSRMLDILWDLSDRKLRLYAVACSRRFLGAAPTPEQLCVVQAGERLADGEEINNDVRGVAGHLRSPFSQLLLSARPAEDTELEAQAGLLRCIFGNPFRPATLDFACRTSAVISLATAAYEERDLPSGHLDPARLVILADALEDGGADPDLVDHLRGPGPHVRGCWAVDLILSKDR
jgi:hypothetical protein